MADVKWIKLTTDMFDNRKIKHLRRLPDGNSIVLIWVMLLTMAGRCNSNGMIFLTENIPYTPKMLADELDFEENTVLLALQHLEQFNMIITDGKHLTIAGWEEYQNIEGMDRIREQNRIRKQRQRANQKLLDSKRDSHVTVTQCHATDIEEDKDKEIESDNKRIISDSANPSPPPTPKKPTKKTKKAEPEKHKRGEYQHVLLTDEEEEKLIDEYGLEFALRAIKFLDEYIEETGYKRKSHYLCIKRWVIDAAKEKEAKDIKAGKVPKARYGDFDPNEAFNIAMERTYGSEQSKTAAEDEALRERMEALKQRIGEG